MRIRNVAVAVVAAMGIAQFASAAQIVPAVGVFDPAFAGPINGTTNPSINSGVVSNEAGMTVGTWQSRIGTAYTDGVGGVWNGSEGTGDDSVNVANGTADTAWQLTIAAGKSFQATSAGLRPAGSLTGGWTTVNPVSGYRFIGANPIQSDSSSISLSLNGYDAGAKIAELGFAYVGRGGHTAGTTAKFTVTYDDLSTATTGDLTALGHGSASFIHFLAPTGLGITKVDMALTIPTGGAHRGIQMDDFGVIAAVPEPASAALVGVSLLGVALRRRKA